MRNETSESDCIPHVLFDDGELFRLSVVICLIPKFPAEEKVFTTWGESAMVPNFENGCCTVFQLSRNRIGLRHFETPDVRYPP